MATYSSLNDLWNPSGIETGRSLSTVFLLCCLNDLWSPSGIEKQDKKIPTEFGRCSASAKKSGLRDRFIISVNALTVFLYCCANNSPLCQDHQSNHHEPKHLFILFC